jgi:hypothetical protein
VATPRPRSSARIRRVGLRSSTRVDALSWASKQFALRAGATVRMRRSRGRTGHPTDRRGCREPRSRRPARIAKVGVDSRRRLRGRAPDEADAREPSSPSRSERPTAARSPSLAPTASDRLTSRRPSASRTRRLQRDATRVGGRSGLADVERPESNPKSRCRERAFRARVRRPLWSPGRIGLVRNRQVRSERACPTRERSQPAGPQAPVIPYETRADGSSDFEGRLPGGQSGAAARPRRDQRHPYGGETTGNRKR